MRKQPHFSPGVDQNMWTYKMILGLEPDLYYEFENVVITVAKFFPEASCVALATFHKSFLRVIKIIIIFILFV